MLSIAAQSPKSSRKAIEQDVDVDDIMGKFFDCANEADHRVLHDDENKCA
jgi:hypothetical protein